MKRIGKKGIAVLLAIITCMSFLAGCGKEAEETNDGKGQLISDEDAAALQYMKKYMVEDVFGDGASYAVYAPEGGDYGDGFLSYIDHGISYFAAVYSGGGEEFPYQMLNEVLKGRKADLEGSGEYSDIQFGEVVKNGADRFVLVSAMDADFYGTPYEKKMLYYLDVPKAGIALIWNVEISEMQVDDTTETILAQMGQCYGIGMDSLMPSGEWVQADAERETAAQDVYEPEEGEPALTKVDGYQYLGQTTLSFEDGEILCPVMAPMGRNTSVRESNVSTSIHGVSVYISGSYTATDQYVPQMKKSAERAYELKVNDESVENRNVHKSDVMEMSGYKDAYYYIVDYETPDYITGDYYKEVKAECWIVIAEKYILDCSITLRANEYDSATNTLMKELETAYGIDLSEYYNEE
ncbi:MAG: hypothetical protein K2N43_01295 [Lachnospiraceae bacterium]|nr:hypothetical protein [Lachnospiraceae bacterium]